MYSTIKHIKNVFLFAFEQLVLALEDLAGCKVSVDAPGKPGGKTVALIADRELRADMAPSFRRFGVKVENTARNLGVDFSLSRHRHFATVRGDRLINAKKRWQRTRRIRSHNLRIRVVKGGLVPGLVYGGGYGDI